MGNKVNPNVYTKKYNSCLSCCNAFFQKPNVTLIRFSILVLNVIQKLQHLWKPKGIKRLIMNFHREKSFFLHGHQVEDWITISFSSIFLKTYNIFKKLETFNF